MPNTSCRGNESEVDTPFCFIRVITKKKDAFVVNNIALPIDRAQLNGDFLNKVKNGEQIQITSHGKVIARLIPEISQIEAAQKRLDKIRGTMIIGDIMEPLNSDWSADADNL